MTKHLKTRNDWWPCSNWYVIDDISVRVMVPHMLVLRLSRTFIMIKAPADRVITGLKGYLTVFHLDHLMYCRAIDLRPPLNFWTTKYSDGTKRHCLVTDLGPDEKYEDSIRLELSITKVGLDSPPRPHPCILIESLDKT